MPLKEGSSREVVSENIKTEMEHGKPQPQAVAIALKEAGLSNQASHREGDVRVVDGIAHDAVTEYEYKQVGPPGLTADEINRRADEYWRQKLAAPEQSSWTYPAPGASPKHQ